MSSVSAEDRAAITDLIARYAWTLDLDDAAGCAGLFTEDGIFDGVGGWYEGREQVRAMAAKSRAGDAPHLIQHWCGNLLFEAAGEAVIVRSMCFGPSTVDGKASIGFVGSYVDRCVRTPDGWRFAYRRWRPWDGTMPEMDPRGAAAGRAQA